VHTIDIVHPDIPSNEVINPDSRLVSSPVFGRSLDSMVYPVLSGIERLRGDVAGEGGEVRCC
jgi:hypothetical protein